MTRLAGHTTTQWSRLTGKRMPPRPFGRSEGVATPSPSRAIGATEMILPDWLMYTGAPDWVGFMDMERTAAEYMVSEDGQANFIPTIDALTEAQAKRMLYFMAIRVVVGGGEDSVVQG